MKKLLISLSLLWAAGAYAYDFSASSGGTTLYYNVVGADAVEVTYDSSMALYNTYAGDVKIPAKVSHAGTDYRVAGVGDRAFAYCDELTSVRLPESMERIGDRAFVGCSALAEMRLPASLTQIGAGAFAWCDAITTVTIPASTVMVSPGAFEGCLSLTDIDVESGNPAYTSVDGILLDTSGSTLVIYPAGRGGAYDLPHNISAVGAQAFYGCSSLSAVKLPQTLNAIGDNAFYYCNSLESVSIPETVQHIGGNAFADCFSLRSIDVDGGNPWYSSYGGVLYDKERTCLLQSPAGNPGTDSIPATVTSVADYAYFRNYALKSMAVPTGITEVGTGAFIDCGNMVSLSLPSSIRRIGDFAFGMCSGLEHIYLDVEDPAGIILGEEMFANVPLDKCTLYVPRVGLTNYQGKIPWCYFAIIEGFGELWQQTIEWPQDLKPECGDNATLSARASSGLPVSYSVSPLSEAGAVIHADKVTFTDAGTLVITAYQQGNHEYLPAPPVSKTITVRADTGIDDVLADACDIRVYAIDGRIVVKGAPHNAHICIYGIGGEQVYSGRTTTVPVPHSHVYIVRVGGKAFKIAVR